MITAADLDRLRERAAESASPMLSVYLDVDQSRASNLNRKFEAALKARLRALEQKLGDGEREAFRAHAARVEEFVAGYRPRGKTLVVFADDAQGAFWSRDLHVPLQTDVRWRPAPYIRPLVEALDEHERYAVVLASKERTRLFVAFLGEIEEKGEVVASGEVRHKQSSGTDRLRSQMNFQRQDDEHVSRHLRQVVARLEEVVRAGAMHRVVLAGPVEVTSELVRLLPHALAARVVGTVPLTVEASPDEVLAKTLEIAQRVEREAEQAQVRNLLDRGAVALEATLLAYQERRLLVLIYAEGFAAGGAECPQCRALLARADAACAFCGARPRPLDDLLERLVERAAEAGAKVEQVRGDAAVRLRQAGGIGALLRF